ADIRSDIYSLGCTLYELLTGRPPFPKGTTTEKFLRHAESPVPMPADWPAGLRAVVGRMTAKDPAARYQTPAEAAEALASAERGAPNPRRKNPRVRALVAAAFLSLAALLVAASVLIRIRTDKGDIVVETDDPNLEIVTRKGGAIVRIRDPK